MEQYPGRVLVCPRKNCQGIFLAGTTLCTCSAMQLYQSPVGTGIICVNGHQHLQMLVDVVASAELSNDTAWRVANLEELKEDEIGYDIGPETTINFEMMLSDKKTIIWNGPMGVFEIPAFSTGTQAIASVIRDHTEEGAVSIIGGGDTAAALKNYGITDGFTHISTGGGASLQLMSGKQLPALEALHQYA